MKVNKHPWLLGGALTAIAALSLTACGGSGSNTPAVSSSPAAAQSSPAAASGGKLTVWVDANREPVLKDAAADFEKQSGVKVDLVIKDFSKIQEDFLRQVPTGKGPDITIGAHDWLGNLVNNGVVQPVELGDKAGEFQDVAVNAMSYEGNTYGVPYATENLALLRNADLVKEAPKSFDDMIAAGEKAGTEFPFLVQVSDVGDPFHAYPFQTSFGAPVFGTDDTGAYDPADLQIGNEGGIEFAKWLAEEGEEGNLKTSLDGDIAKEKFVSGDSPFFLTGPWNVEAVEEAEINLEIDPIPSAGGEQAQPFVAVQGFFVSAKTENLLAATEFLTNYIGTEEVQTELYEVGNRPPANKAAFEAAKADETIAAFGEVGANGVPMPNIPEMAAVWEFWGVAEAEIITGKADPAKRWKQMTSDIEKAISK
ncbi:MULTISPECIES: sugar ABC transporter substrate-binding protein [Micrococcaceae]|uniref:sugar ABC transporter substrate-binding protein n=3 Tax=Micrococcales TaxID=85006 RepID=UPI000CFDD04B|nr:MULTISPECIES: maltose ABC transporter substrate-binding protein [unclassified Arthrobacter]PQZ85848.1 maltose ABC transporter substrate-binding protein [Arthrobacter sp. MYb222]PRB73923.1 maltose ABC transporter substrate-binding protein [Arthrobacter sp. MYb214]